MFTSHQTSGLLLTSNPGLYKENFTLVQDFGSSVTTNLPRHPHPPPLPPPIQTPSLVEVWPSVSLLRVFWAVVLVLLPLFPLQLSNQQNNPNESFQTFVAHNPWLPRVVNFKFPLQPHQKYCITLNCSLLRWKTIHTNAGYLLTHFSLTLSLPSSKSTFSQRFKCLSKMSNSRHGNLAHVPFVCIVRVWHHTTLTWGVFGI